MMMPMMPEIAFCKWCDSPIKWGKVREIPLDSNDAPLAGGRIITSFRAYNDPNECVNPLNKGDSPEGERHKCMRCKGCKKMLIHIPEDKAHGKKEFYATAQSDQTKKHLCRQFLEQREKEESQFIG
jgi:hypothetical protein